MNEVKLLISGKEYAVACAPGEEDHVIQLGQVIDAKVRSLGDSGNTGEIKKILFGALFLADELHEMRLKTAADTARFASEKTALEEERRIANVAAGQRDALSSKIQDLESELEGLQSAQQQHSAEVDAMRAELQQRRDEAEDIRSAREIAETKLAEVQRDRDNLAGQIPNKDKLLENANRLIDETKAKLAAANAAAASTITAAALDPELAPALERFAELLETCADKLEAQARST